ncbi:hypothetical protein ACF0H5_003608 [Mactra antiquata]
MRSEVGDLTNHQLQRHRYTPRLGRTTVTISEHTESVLDTIGKDSVSVNGVEATGCLDSAYIQLSWLVNKGISVHLCQF